MGKGSSPPPHVLIFPFPAQGHVNSMLKLAELLLLSGFQVTFLNTEHVQDRLDRFTDTRSRFGSYAGFGFKTIPDGLPSEHPRAGDPRTIVELFKSLSSEAGPLFKEVLVGGGGLAVDCIIGDGLMAFVLEVASEVGVPVVHFRTIGASAMWTYFCLPDVIEAGELPMQGKEGMDRPVTKVQGMETFLLCRDLPSMCRVNDMNDPFLQMVIAATRQSSKVRSLVLNTCEDLEAPILSHIRSHINPNTYTIGPLHEHLKAKLANQSVARGGTGDHTQYSSSSGDLWEVDRSCLEWLDDQAPRSVIYVSFGSIALTTRDQLMEFWFGLVNSKTRFLWVRRPGSITNCSKEEEQATDVPVELIEGTKERGKIVEWAPQEEVLAHEAVGGFLTHSGWNSTLESITAGVPMICWPYFADQPVNSSFVDKVWKVGLDMKDVCDRIVVEKMVNDLMVERREEFLGTASKMAELARKSLSEGGSSFCNLERLIQDIRSLTS